MVTNITYQISIIGGRGIKRERYKEGEKEGDRDRERKRYKCRQFDRKMGKISMGKKLVLESNICDMTEDSLYNEG